MSQIFDDYTKATFPLEVKWGDNGKVRLLAAFDNRVIGASYRSFERDGETIEYLSQSLDWDGQGRFAEGRHPDMDLPPPPAKMAEKIAAWEREIAASQARLDAMPDAPAEWRGIDENRIKALSRKISDLAGGAA